MPHKTAAGTPRQQRAAKARRILAGVTRDDSDDELGDEDHPWEWVYEKGEKEEKEEDEGLAEESEDEQSTTTRKRRSKPMRYAPSKQRIIGAKMGSNFKCKIGDCVLLKAEGTNSAWVAIICEFMESDDGEKVAKFMCKRISQPCLANVNKA